MGDLTAYDANTPVQFMDEDGHNRERRTIAPFGMLFPLAVGFQVSTLSVSLQSCPPGYTVCIDGEVPIGEGVEIAEFLTGRRVTIQNNNSIDNLRFVDCGIQTLLIFACDLVQTIISCVPRTFIQACATLSNIVLRNSVQTLTVGNCLSLRLISGSTAARISVIACPVLCRLPKLIEPGCGYTIRAGCGRLAPPVVPMPTIYLGDVAGGGPPFPAGSALEDRWCDGFNSAEAKLAILPTEYNQFIFSETKPANYPAGQRWFPLVVANTEQGWLEYYTSRPRYRAYVESIDAQDERVRLSIMSSRRASTFSYLPPEMWLMIRQFLLPVHRDLPPPRNPNGQ